MRIINTALSFFGLLVFISLPLHAQVYIDPGVGAVIKDNTGSMTPRFNIGVHNLLFRRVGIYGTLEFPKSAGSELFKDSDARDIIGGMFRINNHLSLYGGAGVFSNGLIEKDFKLDGVRKEVGLQFNIPKARLSIDLGYSTTAGISTNLGFIIPIGKKSKEEKGSDPKKSNLSPDTQQIVSEDSKKEAIAAQPENKTEIKPKVADEVKRQETVKEVKEAEPVKSGPVSVAASKSTATKGSSTTKDNTNASGEELAPGNYAVNGVFKSFANAQNEVKLLAKDGFKDAKIGFIAAKNQYYVYLLFSNQEQVIKDFVLKNRENGKLSGVWLLRVK